MERSSIIFAFLLLLAASSTIQEGAKAACEFGEATAKQSAKPVSDLAVKLYQELAKPDSNSVFSPVSIALALALVERGAAGPTKDEILKLIGSKGSSDSSSLYQALQHQLQIKSENARLSIANGLFHSDKLRLKPDYLDNIKRCFETEIMAEPFGTRPDDARLQINRWVANRTADKIPELLKPRTIDEGTLAVLANAVYLKAPWLHRLDVIGDRVFYQSGRADQAQMVKFISLDEEHLNYYSTNNFEMVELPFEDVPLSMFIILPKKRDGIGAVEKSLTGDQLISILEKGDSRKVSLKLPKFTIRQSVQLKPIMINLGLQRIFNNQGNFSRMSPGDLKFNNGVHEAFIKVNENGTEAAAATALDVIAASLDISRPIPFVADHPFIFAIVHKPTSAIVFMGKVNSIDKQE